MSEEKKNKKRKAVSMPEKIQSLKEKLNYLEKLEKERNKKIDTRRKVLAGSYLLNKYNDKPDELAKLLDPFLTRDKDRELFGLLPIKKAD
mgnify:CR=1 FL=1